MRTTSVSCTHNLKLNRLLVDLDRSETLMIAGEQKIKYRWEIRALEKRGSHGKRGKNGREDRAGQRGFVKIKGVSTQKKKGNISRIT